MAKRYSSKEFLQELTAFADEQRRLIDAECDQFDISASARDMRVTRSENDFKFWCQTYFPHYVKGEPSLFHDYAFEDIPKKIDAEEGCREAIAAPRGEAKSTILTQLLNIWCVVTERKHFEVIIMDSFDQSAMMLEAIKVELESNPRLLNDYPKATGKGRVWQVGIILTTNNIKIQIAGSGKKIRGWRHGPHRPDLVTLDDIENDENVAKKEQRDKTLRWVRQAVLNLGPPDGSMDVIWVGTVLHYDAAFARTLRSPTWNSKIFKAIMQWPDRMDMWQRWEEILINQGDELADAYYRQNKVIMDAGAVVSWPSVRPLVRLMKIRAEDHHAFDCEYQNDPTNDDMAPFKIMHFWVQVCRDWIFYGACDPSLGKNNKARDPSAILVGGFDRNHGVLDIVEASVCRRVPDKIISDIIEFERQYHCMVWGIETIQFQEFLKTEIVKRSAAMRIPVPARGITPNTDKALRIESLQPHVTNGLIRFHRNHTVLNEQLRHWPEADHDDGPDALHMLWMLAVSGAGGLPQVLTAARRGRNPLRGY